MHALRPVALDSGACPARPSSSATTTSVASRSRSAAARDGRGGLAVVEGPRRDRQDRPARRRARGGGGAGHGRAARPRGRARARVRLRRRPPAVRAAARGGRRRTQRAELLDGAGGHRRRPARAADGRARRRTPRCPTRPSPSSTGCTGCAPTSPTAARSCCSSTTSTGPTPPSVRFLAFLATRLEELPVVVCLATRPELQGAGGGAARRAARRPGDVERAARRRSRRRRSASCSSCALGVPPDPAFAEVCHAVTGGRPFFVRQLVGVLRDESVAPTAAAAATVERQGARGVRRWVLLRIARLTPAGRPAGARPGDPRASAAAPGGGAGGAGGRGGGRRRRRARRGGHRRPASARWPSSTPWCARRSTRSSPRSSAPQGHRRGRPSSPRRSPTASAKVAEHLLATEPAGDAWVAERLAAAAASAARTGAHESAIAFLERALAEPPPPERRPELELALGMAEMNAGPAGGGDAPRRRRAAALPSRGRARRGRARPGAAARPARTAARDALAVLDRFARRRRRARARRRSSRPTSRRSRSGCSSARTAPAVAARAARLRAQADAPDAPRELLGLAAYLAGNAGEPAPAVRALARRTLAGGATPTPADLAWFPQATVGLVLRRGLRGGAGRLRRRRSPRRRASGDGALLAAAGAQRAWTLLRMGDLLGRGGSTRAPCSRRPCSRAPPLYRALACGVLVGALQEQGALLHADAAMAPFAPLAEHDTQTSAVLRFARGQLRVAQRRLPAARSRTCAPSAQLSLATGAPSPGNLPWRSALRHGAARRRATAAGTRRWRSREEEVELARAAELPRALGIALRTAALAGPAERARGAAAGGGRRARARPARGRARRRAARARRAPAARRAAGRTRARICARRSTRPTGCGPGRWRQGPRRSCGRRARGRGGRR